MSTMNMCTQQSGADAGGGAMPTMGYGSRLHGAQLARTNASLFSPVAVPAL